MDKAFDRIIAEIIEKDPRKYHEAIKEQDVWQLHYHLSPLRAGLIGWYPFEAEWEALEIGAGFGSLTEVLCEKCRSVDAVEKDPLRAKAIEKRTEGRAKVSSEIPGKKYDCILVSDLDEEADRQNTIKECSDHLKEDGVLLVCFHNRDSYRYGCGLRDEAVRIAFDTSKLITGREFEKIAQECGFTYTYCYYPLPNALFPQVIYSEEELPDEETEDRILFFDAFESPAVKDEKQALKAVIERESFEAEAPLYLVELKKLRKDEKRKVTKTVLSPDRGRDKAACVLFYGDGRVEKRSLWPEDKAYMSLQNANLADLKERGIKVIEQELQKGCLFMERMRHETMLHYLMKNPEETETMLELLKRDILKSSETVKAGKAAAEFWGIGEEESVLKTGFTDMSPFNCFVKEREPVFFDQEFTVENCPLSYIMFRAVFYLFIHIPQLPEIVSRDGLMEKYGIKGHWDRFREIELAFVDENRNREVFRQFWNWSQKEKGPEKIRQAVTEKADKNELCARIHEVQLDLIKRFDDVCQRHGLKYFAIHGTLLGAVRHGGFIPWDDDADIAMPREDYNRLIKIAGNEFRGDVCLQHPLSDHASFYGGYAKLRNTAVKALPEDIRLSAGIQGIWIDILPLDHVSEDAGQRADQMKKINELQLMKYCRSYAVNRFPLDGFRGRELVKMYLKAGRGSHESWMKKLESCCTQVKDSSMLGIVECYYGEKENQNYFPKEWFEDQLFLPFMDMEIPVPSGYDNILKKRYGKDYMGIPEKNKRYSHEKILFDV